MIDDPTLDDLLAERQALSTDAVPTDEPTSQWVVVAMQDQWFGFPGARIKEIFADLPVYFLPGCPAALEGVIHVRGDILSVIRLSVLLNLADRAGSSDSRILLARTETLQSGIRVDHVADVIDIKHSAVREPPHSIDEPLRSVVTGIVAFRDHLVHLLDLDRLFADYRAGLR